MKDNKNEYASFVADTPQAGYGGSENTRPQNEKKPYRKPGYRFEKVFETMALHCGKVQPTDFLCHAHPNRS